MGGYSVRKPTPILFRRRKSLRKVPGEDWDDVRGPTKLLLISAMLPQQQAEQDCLQQQLLQQPSLSRRRQQEQRSHAVDVRRLPNRQIARKERGRLARIRPSLSPMRVGATLRGAAVVSNFLLPPLRRLPDEDFPSNDPYVEYGARMTFTQ